MALRIKPEGIDEVNFLIETLFLPTLPTFPWPIILSATGILHFNVIRDDMR
eukprot:COSAG02_NODE_239_length_27693_cov_31.385700_1_plen_51_part_00